MTDDLQMKIAKLQLDENDVVVVKVNGILTKETHKRITEHFQQELPRVKTMVVGEEIELSVLTPAKSKAGCCVSEMVERVARAMWGAREETLPERVRVPFDGRLTGDIFVMARSAIEAMREPTTAMKRAACKAMSPGKREGQPRVSNKEKHRIRYQAMIDAALTEAKTNAEESA